MCNCKKRFSVISFNSVASRDAFWPLVNGGAVTCINPLNWKKDGTPANSSLNKGMLVQQHWLHCWGIDYENLPDATINEARGTIVTTINDPRFRYESNTALAGEKSYHTYDYAFYYMNLRENGKKRIESYLGKEI